MCSYKEGGLHDAALLNMLNGKVGGIGDCENGGDRESSEIDVGSDCSGFVEESDRLRPAGVMYCHLTATVRMIAANELLQQFCSVSCSCVLTVCSVL